MGKEYPETQMKSMSHPKLTKNTTVSTALNRRTLDDMEGLFLLRTSFHSQFPPEVVDLRPWHNRFFPSHVTISHISYFEKQHL